MKSFIAACTLFLLSTLGVIGNDVYLYHTIEMLEGATAEVMEAPIDSHLLPTLKDEWEKRRLFFSLSTHYNELEALETALAEAEAAQKIKSDSDYYIAVAEIKDSFSRLRELNGFTPFGIL